MHEENKKINDFLALFRLVLKIFAFCYFVILIIIEVSGFVRLNLLMDYELILLVIEVISY